MSKSDGCDYDVVVVVVVLLLLLLQMRYMLSPIRVG